MFLQDWFTHFFLWRCVHTARDANLLREQMVWTQHQSHLHPRKSRNNVWLYLCLLRNSPLRFIIFNFFYKTTFIRRCCDDVRGREVGCWDSTPQVQQTLSHLQHKINDSAVWKASEVKYPRQVEKLWETLLSPWQQIWCFQRTNYWMSTTFWKRWNQTFSGQWAGLSDIWWWGFRCYGDMKTLCTAPLCLVCPLRAPVERRWTPRSVASIVRHLQNSRRNVTIGAKSDFQE